MKINLKEVTVRQVAEGYVDNAEEGVVGYGGKLNIRPKFQREFVYKDNQRSAVIDTIRKGFPLNVMYWVKNGEEGFEVLDGQQRTVSFCQYIDGIYSIDNRTFHNLTEPEKEKILDYKLMIYICEGDEKEKLDWFRIINIAGERLTDQELRNVVYTGPWLSDAKLKFSKTGCAAYGLAKDYVNGTPIRQEYLETALDWISNGKIEGYMSEHQHDPNANALWKYFRNVIEWVGLTFPKYNGKMKGLRWGSLYDSFHEEVFDTKALEKEVDALMMDDDVTNKRGIYPYVLTRSEKYLSLRSFTDAQKIEAYGRQKGICSKCHKHFELSEMEADHITPWSKGGKTIPDNCQMLCKDCNRRKSDV
jgi:hypothetical protein